MLAVMTTSIIGAFWGIASSFGAILSHFLLWHFSPPRRPLPLLVGILFLIPTPLLWWHGTPAALVLHLLICANYLAIYPALQATSPTLKMLNIIGGRAEGITEDALVAAVASQKMVTDRIEELRAAGLLTKPNGQALTRRGALLARAFVLFRRSLGLPLGEG